MNMNTLGLSCVKSGLFNIEIASILQWKMHVEKNMILLWKMFM